ncbi:DNA polymerase III subunit gamma/tau [Endozoicomonas arenosclerae]|uniref:DNA polymerase III subunit gamma/tau n=1 Tax=Endozoicomonas arenosclerae TaxID=1633495 RepID=UPI0007814453|nr:DNA polymerase III subunit gamma/tau [Endozoicomonas arenosclerae]
MSYQVLARKWRPRSFKELVGQTHVLQALVNALDQDRLHHAYLFTGTRGVGKTTIARILAKCLNCETGVSSTPCGQCAACCEIDEGRFVDLIEVDAASRTKVEDTRELLDNVQYAPTRGRYKVYLIDEVHMLSVHSFNALLKTLEEPPPHVKFLLATTDPQKLPVTILSRCLQFGLKNMTPERIVGHLENILGQESIPFEGPALWQLARAADGSMRDSLSLTDQAIAFGNGRVSEQEVSAMLGTIDQGQVMKMVRALSSGGAPEVLSAVASLAEHAPDYAAVLDDMLSMLHRIAIAQAVPDAVDNSQGDREQVLELAGNMLAEDVQLYYQVGLVGKRDLPLAPDPRGGFEMSLLRMLAFRPEPVAIQVPQSSNRESVIQSEASQPVLPPVDPEPEPASVEPVTQYVEPEVSITTPPAIDVAATEVQPAPVFEEQQVTQAVVDQPVIESVENPLPEDFAPEPSQPMEVEVPPLPVEAYQEAEEEDDVPPPVSTYEAYASELASQVAVEPEPVPALIEDEPPQTVKPEERVSLADLDVQSWVPVFRSLPLGGVTRTIASHCEYVSHSAGRIDLRLDSGRSTLYNDTHRQRVEKALSDYFDQPLRVQVEIGQVQAETPAAWRERKIAERMAEARSSIFNDQHVQSLINQFSAVVIEDSIQPIGNVIK